MPRVMDQIREWLRPQAPVMDRKVTVEQASCGCHNCEGLLQMLASLMQRYDDLKRILWLIATAQGGRVYYMDHDLVRFEKRTACLKFYPDPFVHEGKTWVQASTENVPNAEASK